MPFKRALKHRWSFDHKSSHTEIWNIWNYWNYCCGIAFVTGINTAICCVWNIYILYLVAGGQEVVSSSLVTRTIENRWYHWVSAVFTFFWNRNLSVLTTNLPTYRNFTDIFYFYFPGRISCLKSSSKTNWERCLNKLWKMA